MKQAASRLAAFALLVLVGACTGTSEPQAPTVLIVGAEEAGQPQLVLIEDLWGTTANLVGPRFRFVEGSRRPLPAPAVSIDLVGREADRGAAWVLARGVSGTGALPEVSAYLHRFTTAAIDAEAPAGFAEVADARLVLTLPGGGGLLDDPASTRLVCPREIQTTFTGRYVLLLDDPPACAPASVDYPVIWLIDTAAATAVDLSLAAPVLAVAPYVDQDEIEDRGYFLVGGPGSVQLYRVDWSAGTAAPQQEFGLPLALDPSRFIDLTGRGTVLVGLTASPDTLIGFDLTEGVATAPVTTVEEPRRLYADELDRTPQVLVLAAGRLAVHADLEDDEPHVTRAFGAAAAVVDGVRSFAFAVGRGQLLVIDLLPTSESGSLREETFPVAELALPTGPGARPVSVVTWVRSVEPAPAP